MRSGAVFIALVACGLATVAGAQGTVLSFPAPPATLVEELRIDGNREDFSIVQTVLVAPSGRIAVQQPQDYHVRVYSPAGRRLFSFGQRGAGPGEFQFLFPAGGWKADTLWQYDLTHRRLTVITPEGKLARTVTVPTIVTPATATAAALSVPTFPLALTSEGPWLVRATRERYAIDPATQIRPPDAAQLALVNDSGRVQRVIAQVPPSSRGTLYAEGGQYGVGERFAINPIEAIATDGSRAAYLSVATTTATGGTVQLTVMNMRGDTVLARSYPFTGRRLDPAFARAVVENDQSRVGGRVPPAILATMRERSLRSLPAFHAPVRQVKLGLDETVWIRPDSTDGPVRWVRLDSRGTPTLSVSIPARHAFVTGSATHVWMTARDEDDITSVVRYRLQGPR